MTTNHFLDDCPDLLRDFIFYLKTVRGRSPRTADGYYIDLRTFFRYIKATKVLQMTPRYNDEFKAIKIADLSSQQICSVTLSDVYGFVNFCIDELGNHASAQARKVSSIRSFYNYLIKMGHLQESPVKNLDLPTLKRALPKYLTLEESMKLLDSVKSQFTQRDYCMITLMLNCGMRVSELVGIDLTDIHDDTLRLLGKGNKERIVYLNEACQAALDEYLKVRKVPENCSRENKNALFLSNHGKRLTTRRVEQIVEASLKQAGLDGKGISPHKLRHTAATIMFQHGGVDIRVLQEILGHSNLGTTEIYTHISNRQIQDAVHSSPLAKVKPKKTVSVDEILDESEYEAEQEEKQ